MCNAGKNGPRGAVGCTVCSCGAINSYDDNFDWQTDKSDGWVCRVCGLKVSDDNMRWE